MAETNPKPMQTVEKQLPANGKKYRRAPIFGPARLRCYICEHELTVPHFRAVRACPRCGERRFVPAPAVRRTHLFPPRSLRQV